MKISFIFIVTFCFSLYISDGSPAERDENFETGPADETANVIKENGSERVDVERDDKDDLTDEELADLAKNRTNIDHLKLQRGSKGNKGGPPRNCLDIKNRKKKANSGIYTIHPCDDTPSKALSVYCDMTNGGGGWTVIQRRDNYPVQENFYTTWLRYKMGFGNITRDFWLGNENIHCLAKQSVNEVRFDLENFANSKRHATYGFFYVYDEARYYQLVVQNYTGNAGNSFYYNNGMNFTTFDEDNDPWSNNCAIIRQGAWWFKGCTYVNINGLYNGTTYAGLYWYHFAGHTSLKFTEMKIRPRNY